MHILGDVLNIIVIIVGNEVSDPNSNPGQDCLYFTLH